MSIFGTGKPAFVGTTTKSITNATYSGGYVTVFVSSHGYSTGDAVWIQGVVGMTDLNALWEIANGSDPDSFTIQLTTAQSYSSGGTVYNGKFLDKSKIEEYNFVEPDQLENKSVINGVITHEHLGDYCSYRITLFLWQYGATASTVFSALNAYYHTNVIFFPQGNKPIKNSSSSLVYCNFKTFRPFYYRGQRSKDAIDILFTVNGYHDITKLLV